MGLRADTVGWEDWGLRPGIERREPGVREVREARLLFTPTFSQCLSNKGHDSFQKGLMTFFWVLAVAPFLPSLSQIMT